MIVITGPGRSGTSYIAELYKELGFDPGGRWRDELNAGWEDPEVVDLNLGIARDLGVTMERGRRRFRRLPLPAAVVRRSAWLRVGSQTIDWTRVDDVVDRYGSRLVDTASRLGVVKDPKFTWTLPVWLRAGAPVDFVLVAVRSFDDAVNSRFDMGLELWMNRSELRNSLSYGLGLLIEALHGHRVPHAVVRFPDFIDDPMLLYRGAFFPRDVAEEEFLRAVDSIRRTELVHHR